MAEMAAQMKASQGSRVCYTQGAAIAPECTDILSAIAYKIQGEATTSVIPCPVERQSFSNVSLKDRLQNAMWQTPHL